MRFIHKHKKPAETFHCAAHFLPVAFYPKPHFLRPAGRLTANFGSRSAKSGALETSSIYDKKDYAALIPLANVICVTSRLD